jgi:hypothetical protein
MNQISSDPSKPGCSLLAEGAYSFAEVIAFVARCGEVGGTGREIAKHSISSGAMGDDRVHDGFGCSL